MENISLQTTIATEIVPGPNEQAEPRAISTDWRHGLPVLADGCVTLREPRPGDALALFTMLTSDEVTRFISPPPPDVRTFERFIQWGIAERQAGRYACFAMTPAGCDVPVGILQIRQLDPGFSAAECGACLGSAYWGSGIFPAAARLLIDFSVDVLGVHRLEARAAVQNGRGNGAMRKLGAVQEGVLRRSLLCRGQYHDQILWALLAEDWRQARTEYRPRIH